MSNIVVITAPSASGKTTFIKKYISNHPNALFSVSYTTRAIRDGEVDGVDYYFVDVEKFEEMISEDAFIEWAKVHDNYYGTAISEIQKANDNQILILDVDIQGALYLKEKKIEAKYIFIEPPSIDVLRERLIERGSETEDSIKIRLWNAKRELEYKNKFDIIIKNEDINVAYKELENIINN